MAYNNLQILNFNHNIVSLSNGNTLVITDNIKGNSISIPEPITHILQINSPGPQGPQGPSGSGGGGNINTGSFATTGSNTFTDNQIVNGSITTNNGILVKHYPGGFTHATEDYEPGSTGTILYTSVGDQTGNTFVEIGVRQGGGALSSGVLALNANGGGSVAIGKSTAAPASVLDINGNIIITGSSTTNINSGTFTVTSPSIPFLYMTSSGYFKIGSPDGDYGIDMDLSGVGQMRLINGNQITTYAPIVKFGFDGAPVVVEVTGSLEITGSLKQNGYEVKPYKVYTALLTQDHDGSDEQVQNTGTLIIGRTYYILIDQVDSPGYDFTNVGAPSNTSGVYFVATGTTPNSWGANEGGPDILRFNLGAPVVTVLENTIGNIYWTKDLFNNGYYYANLSDGFPQGKTFVKIENPYSNDVSVAVNMANTSVIPPNSIQVTSFYLGVDSGWNGVYVADQRFLDTPIEIRVYN